MADYELELSNALFDIEVAEIKAAVEGQEKAELATCILADAKLGEDDGGHGLLDVFKLAGGEVPDGEAIANTL